ncbi:unnamed protein product [Arctogadus glacialis]
MLPNGSCGNITDIVVRSGPGMSVFFFAAAVAGNLLALFILGVAQRRRSSEPSAFRILVTGLVVTDLLGTCLLSPPVFVCYARRRSLLGLTGDRALCDLFAFAMTFFGLAPMLILTAMALERCLAVCRPYLYAQLARRCFTRAALLLIYLFSAAFCLLPFAGVGRHRQYCPGTWCFIDMSGGRGGGAAAGLAFSLSYSSLMALLIAVVFVCNGAVIVALCRMHRSQRTRRGSVVSGRGAAGSRRRARGWFGQGEEELDHLMLLASMTLIFVVCSLPLTDLWNKSRLFFPVRVYSDFLWRDRFSSSLQGRPGSERQESSEMNPSVPLGSLGNRVRETGFTGQRGGSPALRFRPVDSGDQVVCGVSGPLQRSLDEAVTSLGRPSPPWEGCGREDSGRVSVR